MLGDIGKKDITCLLLLLLFFFFFFLFFCVLLHALGMCQISIKQMHT
jgi:hypothetical protein